MIIKVSQVLSSKTVSVPTAWGDADIIETRVITKAGDDIYLYSYNDIVTGLYKVQKQLMNGWKVRAPKPESMGKIPWQRKYNKI